MQGQDAAEGRYHAFISYSHRDADFGRALHRRLETYRLPRELVGHPGRWGPADRRLVPIFRDREELSAATDLSKAVREALGRSRTLVVVCSPDAAVSRWVAQEIELFRQLHPDRPILAAVARGEPADALPQALRPTGGAPPAADFRQAGDGPRLGLLKLIAAIADLPASELVQLDARRRIRGVTSVTVGAVMATLVMAAMAVVSLDARAEAERRRAQSEGLVEFMLTDLRQRLRGVGRLDVLTAVNARALGYYASQDLGRLPAPSLARRARLLHAMGEDDQKRGETGRAMAQFREARRTTAALMASAPTDPERVFVHAQSEYWLAYADLSAGRRDDARKGFTAYRRLAEQMTALAPREPRYRRELGYALGNLCTVELEAPPNPEAAVLACEAALQAMQAAKTMGLREPIDEDLVNRHAWLADAYRAAGRPDAAFAQRRAQEQVLDRLVADQPKNMDLKQSWVALQSALAVLEFEAGRPAAAKSRLRKARVVVSSMQAFDPENGEWSALAGNIDVSLTYLAKPQ